MNFPSAFQSVIEVTVILKKSNVLYLDFACCLPGLFTLTLDHAFHPTVLFHSCICICFVRGIPIFVDPVLGFLLWCTHLSLISVFELRNKGSHLWNYYTA